MVFIQTLNKFPIASINTKDVQFINSIYNQQIPNNVIMPYLFYTNKLVQKHNENLFINTLSLTFIFKAMDINHQSCLLVKKPSNYPSKTIGLYSTIHIKKNMLVELCANNYATLDGLVNVVDGIFKTSTTYCDKNHHMKYNV